MCHHSKAENGDNRYIGMDKLPSSNVIVFPAPSEEDIRESIDGLHMLMVEYCGATEYTGIR